MPQKYRQYRPSLQKNLQATQKPNHWRLVLLVIVGVIILLTPVIWITQTKENQDAESAAETSGPTFDKTQFSLDDPTSPWVVVNKLRPLTPKTYAPSNLIAPTNIALRGAKTSEAMQMTLQTATALDTLNEAAKAEGIKLTVVSAYRSYDTQEMIYQSEVKGFGQSIADQESARPGHSEHQTGWAVDLGRPDGKCEIEACFADTPEGQWLAANAHTYGFIIRYAKDKTDITGYVYEPWHLRYVGTVLAEEMHRTNTQTLEEFFSLPSAKSY